MRNTAEPGNRSLGIAAAAVLLLFQAADALGQGSIEQNGIRLTPGIVIESSAVVETDRYYIAADSTGAIFISGDDIVVDFRGAELIGSAANTDTEARPGVRPDLFTGTGIRVEGRNIVIRNVIVRGYKIALWASNSPGLRISKQ